MSKTQFLSELDERQIKISSAILRALAHPLRLKIIKLLHEHKRMSVNEVQQALDLEQSIASQHLKILSKSGLLIHSRKGKYIFYSIEYKNLTHFVNVITSFNNDTLQE